MNEYLKIFGAIHVKNALNLPSNIENIYDQVSEKLENYSISLNNKACPPVMAAFERDIDF